MAEQIAQALRQSDARQQALEERLAAMTLELDSARRKSSRAGQLAEAAATRAQQQRTPQSELRQLTSIVDTKVLDRVKDFDGRDESWTVWSFGFQATAGLLGLEEAMQTAVDVATDQEASLAALGDHEIVVKSKALYFILIQACSGKAANILTSCERHNGLLVWRYLVQEYAPNVGGRANAMYMGILTPTWKSDVTWQENLRAWEVMISEYDQMTGELVTDRTKVSVITRWSPEAIRR